MATDRPATSTGIVDPKPAVRLAAAGFVVLLAGLIAYGFWGFSYDDNYITYRYAHNLARGEGMVFTPGEAVLGTSAPGYAVLLAAASRIGAPLGVDVPAAGTLATVVSLLVLMGLLGRGARRGGHGAAPWLVVLAAAIILPLPLVVQLLGAEAFVVAAAIGAATDALGRARRDVLAGLLVFLAMAVRLDAGLAAAALGLVAWAHRRALPWRFAVAGLVPLGGWLAYLHLRFGRFVPHTLEGKTALRDVPYTLRTWQLLDTTLGTLVATSLVGAAVIGVVAAVLRGWHRRPAFQALALWVLGHEIAYRVIGVWFAPWYEVYLLLALGVLAALGIVDACVRLGRLVVGSDTRGRPLAIGAAVAVAGLIWLPSARFVVETWRVPPDPRFPIYAAAGRYLDDHTPPGASVLAYEIGVLGYWADRPILDLGALVSPQMVAPKFEGTRPAAAAAAQPDYIVDMATNPLLRRVMAADGIDGRYEKIETLRDPRFGGGAITIWQRRDARAGAPSP